MLNFKEFLIKIKKINNPYGWDIVSQRFYDKIKSNIKKSDSVIEFGSSTGHISYELSKRGYNLTLLDIRQGAINEARNIFTKRNIKAEFIAGDIFNQGKNYNFAWNSGLIQCFDDAGKEKLIRKISLISERMLLFYPDTQDSRKIKGADINEIPGVGKAKEYDIKKIPEITYKYFNEIKLGKFESEDIKLDYGMYWLLAKNK